MYEEINRDPKRIHLAEQAWGDACASLDEVMAFIHKSEDAVYREAGGNTDASVLFDFMKEYVINSEIAGNMQYTFQHGHQPECPSPAHMATILFCAAALTKLARAPRVNDPLAQLDKEIGK